jgi:hypothetical protein
MEATMNLDTRQAAVYMAKQGVNFREGTLRLWRRLGRGPAFKKVGGRVFYEQQMLDRFIGGA